MRSAEWKQAEASPSDTGIAVDDRVLRAIRTDIYNTYASAKVEFLYAKLEEGMGPWTAESLTMETFFELDALQGAVVMAYGRVFVGGVRRISENKVPVELRPIHDQVMALRNKRYAHNDEHDTLDARVDLEARGGQVFVKPVLMMGMALGAPPEWKPLFRWLNEYCHEQLRIQLSRLSERTGKTWVFPEGPPPSWVDDQT